MKTGIYLCIIGLLINISVVRAQESHDSTQVWRIVTVDGNEFIGTVVFKNTTVIVTSPIYGEMELNRATINKIEPIKDEQLKKGELWDENPQSTRYLWQPNGYGLRKGEGYYQNTWVMFNQASYGFTNNFSMGVGTIPLFLFGSETTPFWFTPKVSVPVVKNHFNLGAGAIVASATADEAEWVGLLYGVATLGNRDMNFNFGMGYGFIGQEWAKSPVYTFSSMIRLNRKSYMLTENYLISDGEYTISLLSIGGRTVWPKVSIDYALIIPVFEDMDQFVAIPWLGFVIPFGKY